MGRPRWRKKPLPISNAALRRRNASNDLTHRFPLIVETLARLRSRSCIIDGETVACDDNGVASFDLNR
jgi:ATP-dependent DNA ligase